MSDLAIIIAVVIFVIWIFRPNSGNKHLQEREQEIEDLAREIMYRKPNISYSEAYKEAINKLNNNNNG